MASIFHLAKNHQFQEDSALKMKRKNNQAKIIIFNVLKPNAILMIPKMKIWIFQWYKIMKNSKIF